MGYLIASFVIGVIGFALYIPGQMLERQSRHFEENKRRGSAEVVGHQHVKESRQYLLALRLRELNDGKTYLCSGKGISPSKYPKGTIVDVQYAPQRVLGVHTMKVELLNVPHASGVRTGMWIKRIAVILLVIACLLAVLGIITLL